MTETKPVSKSLGKFIVLLLIAIAMGLAFYYRDQLDIQGFEAWLEDAGYWGPVVFMLIYAIATLLILPGSLLTLTGGAVFGPVWGTIYNLTGAIIGATLAFVLARYLGEEWVHKHMGPKFKRVMEGVEEEGWKFIAFTRLVPFFPFNALNYALGITRIPISQYIIASYVFMLPGTFAYTWLGYTGKQALTEDDGLIRNILIALALLATVAFIPRLLLKLRANKYGSSPD